MVKMCNRNWRLSFRRWLSENLQDQLRDLNNMVFRYKTNSQADGVIWRRGKTAIFSVSSVYNHLFKNWDGNDNKQIWKAKIPLKIKIFMWLTL
jgi:hypothetical protein